jgi:hypothetical protein
LRTEESIHGKYSRIDEGRTQEIQTHRPQEGESGKAEEAARLCARVEEAQGEEVGSRPVEAVRLGSAVRVWTADSLRLACRLLLIDSHHRAAVHA